ncbi:MAG: histidine--tRNA ligase [Bacteroidetes bacterium]|nr:histidine--tRNA ligase [Bacteroidota bacterium]
MSVQKPSIPKGTRDFTPTEMVRRNFIFNTVRSVFEIFGYLPIETPAMENLSTLMGKYGEEGDKLLFKILNSGNYLEGIPDSGYQMTDDSNPVSGIRHLKSDIGAFTRHISEKGLRYDLTVPFARFVVQHQNELVFPFKRYQIQPVWRADRPQKGRYREFFQCDVDVIGSPSLLYEVELIQIIDEVFSRLGIQTTTLFNNRKILAGIAEAIGAPEKMNEITVAIDKLDKIGLEKVCLELKEKDLHDSAISALQPVLLMEGSINDKILVLEDLFKLSETGMKGIVELKHLVSLLKDLDLRNKWTFDVRLARGLNYYTGTIIEVKANEVAMGSICGGGRYDDLTGIFGLPGVSGVGISFGADRIYDVMNELNLFPETIQHTTRVLFVNFGPEEERFALKLLNEIRHEGIPAEIYPDSSKLKKQLEYASRKQIPLAVLIGKDEMESGLLTVKDLASGVQSRLSTEEFIRSLKNI